jgi:hypothetical protein
MDKTQKLVVLVSPILGGNPLNPLKPHIFIRR